MDEVDLAHLIMKHSYLDTQEADELARKIIGALFPTVDLTKIKPGDTVYIKMTVPTDHTETFITKKADKIFAHFPQERIVDANKTIDSKQKVCPYQDVICQWKECTYCYYLPKPFPTVNLCDTCANVCKSSHRDRSECSLYRSQEDEDWMNAPLGKPKQEPCEHKIISSSTIGGKLNNLNCVECGKDFMPNVKPFPKQENPDGLDYLRRHSGSQSSWPSSPTEKIKPFEAKYQSDNVRLEIAEIKDKLDEIITKINSND